MGQSVGGIEIVAPLRCLRAANPFAPALGWPTHALKHSGLRPVSASRMPGSHPRYVPALVMRCRADYNAGVCKEEATIWAFSGIC